MNIGLFADCYTPTVSGVVTSLLQLKQGLEQRGHRVLIFTVAGPEYVDQDSAVHNVPSLPFNRASGFRLGLTKPRAIERLVRAEALDLIHTHTEYSLGWMGKRAARRLHLPLVHTAHTLHQEYRHYLPLGRLVSTRMVQRYLKLFLADYDLVVCPSNKALAYVRTSAPEVKTVVVENGIARERFMPHPLTPDQWCTARQALGLSTSDRVLLYVGRIAPEKRVLELLAALTPLLRHHTHYKLLFVGDGPAREHLLQARNRSGLQDQVLSVGRVAWEQTHRFYAIADLFVTASLSEVQPMTLIEASLCGLPIVARRDASFAGLVEDGHNGYLVDADLQLADCAAGLLRDESRRNTFAHNSLLRAQGFTAEKHVETIETLYQKLTNR